MKHQLSQQEIDAYFQPANPKGEPAKETAVSFDFRRLDRIPKSQVMAIHHLHEAFVRTLASSLSAYLRSFVTGTLISVEQLPYSDFAESLPSPSCLVYLRMHPYEGHTLIEINPSLVVPILDLLLGGNGKAQTAADREITEVEQNVMEGFVDIVAHDLRETWKPVVAVDFTVGAIETRAQMSGRFVATEAVVAITMELRIGETVGMVNVAIPSITLKMMGQRFDQQWTVHRSENPETERAIKQKLSRDLIVQVDCEMNGMTMRIGDLLNLAPGDVFRGAPAFDKPLDILVNGRPKLKAVLESVDRRMCAVVQ